MSDPAAFATWVNAQARTVGYELDSPGERPRLAAAANMSVSSLARALSGRQVPGAAGLRGLAFALAVPLADMLAAAVPED